MDQSSFNCLAVIKTKLKKQDFYSSSVISLCQMWCMIFRVRQCQLWALLFCRAGVWFIGLWAHQSTWSFIRLIFAASSQHDGIVTFPHAASRNAEMNRVASQMIWSQTYGKGKLHFLSRCTGILRSLSRNSTFLRWCRMDILLLSPVMMCSVRCYTSISGLHYCTPTYLHYVKTGKCFS